MLLVLASSLDLDLCRHFTPFLQAGVQQMGRCRQGMSLYPYWAAGNGHTDADKVIADCAANIQHVYERFGKESMIVETGAP